MHTPRPHISSPALLVSPHHARASRVTRTCRRSSRSLNGHMRHIINTTHTMALTGIFALSLSACDSDDGDTGAAIDIAGSYADDFGRYPDQRRRLDPVLRGRCRLFLRVRRDRQRGSVRHRAKRRGQRFAPSMYSKFEWTFDDAGDLYYCQPAFDAMTAEDASAASADTGDLAAGCGGFGWSKLTAS